jgi:hypothetical protein
MIGKFGAWSSNRQWRGLGGNPTKVASSIVAASIFRRNASRLRRNPSSKKDEMQKGELARFRCAERAPLSLRIIVRPCASQLGATVE